MSKALTGILLLITMLATTPAMGAEPRLDFSNPVVGESIEAIVDRVPPGTGVFLEFEYQGEPTRTSQVVFADPSGCARIEWNVPAEWAGRTWFVSARLLSDGSRIEAPAPIRYQWPQLLVTGSAAGSSYLYRVQVDQSSEPFLLLERVPLGTGRTGGAVRDGRGTRTFVVADADVGLISIIPDRELNGAVTGTLSVPGDVRSITRTSDGSRVLVCSAGNAGDSTLTIIDTRAESLSKMIIASIPLEPLGPLGGKVVVSDDGMRAFVTVQGLYLREINLVRNEAGYLIAVGGPGQDQVRDLKIVDGFVFALTGRSDRDNYLTGLEAGDLRNASLEGPTRSISRPGVATSSDRSSVLLLDGKGGLLTVIDARTMVPRGAPFSVPAGARALLLAPNPKRSSGALLFDSGLGSDIVSIEFDRFSTGPRVALDRRSWETSVIGSSRQIDWLFVGSSTIPLIALHPDTVQPDMLVTRVVPLPGIEEVTAVSVD